MKCFYHKADLDGHCAGAIIKNRFPQCEMIGVDYKDRAPTIDPGELVYVVDFSFPVEDMLYLLETGALFWIDHHKSAIEKMGWQDIPGLREIGKAGCELTWEYVVDAPMPLAVHLLGRYDVWDHQDERVLPFQYGMRNLPNTYPDAEIWADLLDPRKGFLFVERICDTGETILAYEKKQNSMYAKGMCFEVLFHGHPAIVMNKPYANSKAFDAVYDPEKHDIMILFGVKPGEYKYTLYSGKPDIDVSAIAKLYGGGGHAGAAGFYSKELLF